MRPGIRSFGSQPTGFDPDNFFGVAQPPWDSPTWLLPGTGTQAQAGASSVLYNPDDATATRASGKPRPGCCCAGWGERA